MDDLPLFEWIPPEPPRTVVPFPLARRKAKVMDVAEKLATKSTARHVDAYRDQVTDALCRQMAGYGIASSVQSKEIASFWQAVAVEMVRRGMRGRQGPGAA